MVTVKVGETRVSAFGHKTVEVTVTTNAPITAESIAALYAAAEDCVTQHLDQYELDAATAERIAECLDDMTEERYWTDPCDHDREDDSDEPPF